LEKATGKEFCATPSVANRLQTIIGHCHGHELHTGRGRKMLVILPCLDDRQNVNGYCMKLTP
jgi:hypothetical protein